MMQLSTTNGRYRYSKKSPSEAFLSPKGKINDNKESKDTENYNVDLNEIEKQSKMDISRNACFLNGEEIQSDDESIFNNLEKKIRENFSNNADKIIKKILSFPGQSCHEFTLAIQTFFSEKTGKVIAPSAKNIQLKIEIINDDVYLYMCSKYPIFNGDSSSCEPFCIEDSKKYRLNDQKEGKYTVPTLLAEHIAVFEAKPHVTDNEDLAYLKIGEKKSEFNWINPNQNPENEELVTFDVKKDAANDEKK